MPETLVVPGVLANAYAQADAVELNHSLLLCRGKITLLVEYVVKRQQPLVLLKEELPAIQENRGVDGRLAASRLRGQGYARNHRRGQLRCSRRQFIHCRAAAGKEAGLLKKVGGRIAADGQLGEYGQPDALRGGPPAGGNNLFKISAEISNCGIDLGESDLHTFSLIPNGE